MGSKSSTTKCKNCKIILEHNENILNSGLCSICKFNESTRCNTHNFASSRKRAFTEASLLLNKGNEKVKNSIYSNEAPMKVIDFRNIPRDDNTIIIWPSKT